MIFDTHAHYDDKQFNEDREQMLASMQDGGIGTIVNVSSDVASWEDIRKLTQKYSFIYGAAGVHPDDVGDLNDDNFTRLKNILQEKKMVAVGEIGLDYYWEKESHDEQKSWFIRQMELAEELDMPVIIHSRDAAADTLEIMKKYGKDLGGVIHCFSYSAELAKEYVNMGFFIGVGGVVTFKNARKLKEVVEDIPLDFLVLETDSPYLAPEPNRGKRNSSLNLTYVAEQIAKLKGIPYEEVIAQTERNARKLYRLE